MNTTAAHAQSVSSCYSSPHIMPESLPQHAQGPQHTPGPAQFQGASATANSFRPAPMPPQMPPVTRVAQYYASTPKPMPPQTRIMRIIQTVHNYDVGATSTMWEGEDGHIYLNTTVCVGEMVNVHHVQ